MLEIEVKVRDISSAPAEVSVGGEDPSLVRASQTKSFRVKAGGTITIKAGKEEEKVEKDDSGEPLTDISEGNHGNPNGIQTAEISAKSPKPGGETKLVEEDGQLVERSTDPDLAKQTQAGGVEAKTVGATPGPAATDKGSTAESGRKSK